MGRTDTGAALFPTVGALRRDELSGSAATSLA